MLTMLTGIEYPSRIYILIFSQNMSFSTNTSLYFLLVPESYIDFTNNH